jgi:acetyl-CoA synthetase
MAGEPTKMKDATLQALLEENRMFEPSKAFVSQANVKNALLYELAEDDPEEFWSQCAAKLHWFKKWEKLMQWKAPFAKWFLGGKLNACYNCLDRHVEAGLGKKTAIIWEGEVEGEKRITYAQALAEVKRFANALKGRGVGKGDRVAIYMPMIPETAFAMLACARIGAIHTVVFGGFSADALKERILDASAKCLITADGGYRRGNVVALKQTSDEALNGCDCVESVIVVKHAGNTVEMKKGRDLWYHEIIKNVDADCPCEPMDAEDLLFILYTSGTTGKPKGIIHATGGYMTCVTNTVQWVFDLKDRDIFWCTADVGWVTGHSYIVYGPLANAATVVMYEGSPDHPQRNRFWKIIEKYKVTVFYTAPTAIRTFMKWGAQWLEGCDLSSLRLLGSVGEPINPEAWIWYHKYIGKERCPIVDTWWQTETGAIMISPLPGVVATKPGSATRPLPGIKAVLLDESGQELKQGGGYLGITEPWPSMLRGIWGDEERYAKTYWGKFPGIYFPGDGLKIDDDGYYWLLGRVDDIMLVAGHNISTTEVESALVDHPSVAESAVVGVSDELKGQAIAAFVILKEGQTADDKAVEILRGHVAKKIGAIAKPKTIIFTADLPKTRSGKIMRRLLRDVAEGRALGDVTTLADPNVIEKLKTKYEET